MVVGGAVGYVAPIVGYGAALWRANHPILALLVFAAPVVMVVSKAKISERRATKRYVSSGQRQRDLAARSWDQPGWGK
jgi:hypothetical protein